ncbi:hypothetical protein HYC85_021100, partial [Camellia sinensis]
KPEHHGCILYRCCFFNLDDNSAEDGCYSFTIRPEKPRTFKMLEPSKPPHAKKSRKERNLGRLADATGSTKLWNIRSGKNSQKTFMKLLPIATFFRFRFVCKKWNSLPTSHSFSQQCARVVQAQPWFYTITHENVNTGAMYDPSLKKWHHPTNPALPTKLIVLLVVLSAFLTLAIEASLFAILLLNPSRSFQLGLDAKAMADKLSHHRTGTGEEETQKLRTGRGLRRSRRSRRGNRNRLRKRRSRLKSGRMLSRR